MKGYKKILEGVVNIINTTEKSDIGFANICAYIGENCPELIENDDERTRKELISFIRGMLACHDKPNAKRDEKYKSWIAWLEKQSKSIEINPSEFDSQLNRLLKQFESLPKDDIASSLSFYLNVVQNNGTYKEEKQTEQKPANKIEPKFEVDDWVVVDDGRIGRIIKCTKYFADIDLKFSRLSTRVNNIRYWTISDAKDGDVLVNNNDASYIVLFKELSYSGDNIDRFKSYCHYSEGIFNPIEDPSWCCNAFHPATKEQRNTFFAKMKEADYVWDAEKKELKKVEQKPSWSEEDEKMIDDIAIYLSRYSNYISKMHEGNAAKIRKAADWIKSLILQKQYGYNPYKATVESIAEMCKHYDVASHSGLRDFYDNVKVKCKDAIEYDKKNPQK